MTTAAIPSRHYRLTRPDGLGFIRRRSLAQFAICCAGGAAMLAGVVVSAFGTSGRFGVGVSGVLLVIGGAGRTPSGEDLVDLGAPAARYAWRRIRRQADWSAALVPWRGPGLPPLLSGIALFDCDPVRLGRAGGPVGVVVDQADGSVSAVLRVQGEGFLLADPSEQDARVAGFGSALAALGREESAVMRVAWSQFSCPAPVEDHLAYIRDAAKDDPDPRIASDYFDLVAREAGAATRSDVLITLTVGIGRVRPSSTFGGDRLLSAIERLAEECQLLSSELARSGLRSSGPLSAGAIARALRDRLDPAAMTRLGRLGRTLAEHAGVVTVTNAFPLSIEEHRDAVRTDATFHKVLRVAEWPRTAVRADWLAGLLCERSATRSITVVFSPQPRQVARRQATAVATRVGASIEDRERKGRRVGAEERRAQEAAESLDAELEDGAALELLIGLVDVTATSEDELATATDRVMQSAADVGIELRPVRLRQGEALVASLPLGRVVLGRAR